MKRPYSAKEMAAFDGLMKLVDAGADLSGVTVSDIAESAGVGKGTLYLYFKSKDEIIANAILYFIEMGFQHALDGIGSKDSFFQKIEQIFDFLENISGKKSVLIRFLFYRPDLPKKSELASEVRSSMERYRNEISDILYEIAACGSQEGLFSLPEDKAAVGFAFLSVMLGYFQLCCSQDCFEDPVLVLEKGRKDAYNLLLKGLN